MKDNFWSACKPAFVPEISDADVEAMLAVMKPVKRVQRRFRLIETEGVDRRGVAYTWEPKLGRAVRVYTGELDSTEILTFHSYGAPALFKPSLAEVCAGIRRFVPDWHLVRFFALQCCEPLNDAAAAAVLQAGYHVAVCTLFDEELTDADITDLSWPVFEASCRQKDIT